MCIFCGGACGGIGDVLLPTLVTGTGLMMLKLKARREIYKGRNRNGDTNNKSTGEQIPEQNEQADDGIEKSRS
jgi:hypothetical protein